MIIRAESYKNYKFDERTTVKAIQYYSRWRENHNVSKNFERERGRERERNDSERGDLGEGLGVNEAVFMLGKMLVGRKQASSNDKSSD